MPETGHETIEDILGTKQELPSVGESSIERDFDEPSIERGGDKTTFSSNGVLISISPWEEDKSIKFVESGKLMTIPKGSLIGTIDFTPFEGEYEGYVEGIKTITIIVGIKGLSDFFQLLEDPNISNDQKLPYPVYLIGRTNKQMANFAKRIGFKEIVDEEFEEDEDNNREEVQVIVLAKTEEVKPKLDKYEQKYLGSSKLMNRARREADQAA